MHHLELSMSSVQHVWHLGTAKKPGEVFKDTLLSASATFSVSRGADLSFLPVKESRMFLAPRSIPLAQLNRGSQSFIYRFQLCLEVCVCSFHWCDGRFINQTSFPSVSQPASHLHECGAAFVALVWTHVHRQEGEITDSGQSTDTSARDAGSSSLQSILWLVFARSRRVSTPRPRCARSRPPAGGGCDAASGDAGGSGGTCDSAARRSGVACPAPNPHRGSPRPPRPTRGHWCTEGFRCLPVGSWCCNLENKHNKQAAEEGGDVLADFCRHWEALPPLD